MNTVLSVLVGILGLGFLVLVHEFGHFVTAKIAGIRVEEFSIGFGRYLVKKRIGETVYGISAFPVGGYVRVTGMHEEEYMARVEAARERRAASLRDPEARLTGESAIPDEEVAQTPYHRRYYSRPLWQRLIFIVSGVTMNMIIAFVLLWFVGLGGYFVPQTVISEISPNSPAATAGIQPGDKLISIAGQQTDSWPEMQRLIQEHPNETVPVVIERDGARQELRVTMAQRENGQGLLGVTPETQEVKPGVVGAASFAADMTANLFTTTFRVIGQMFTGAAPVTGPEGLAGPVGILTISSQAVQGGFFLYLLAFISVQLAIFNMLPLLPLDGGHAFFAVVQSITRRPISLRTFERVSVVGIALFLLLALVATGNDIGQLLSGGRQL